MQNEKAYRRKSAHEKLINRPYANDFVFFRAYSDRKRSLGTQHDLTAILSEVEQRVITNDYTIRHDRKTFQIVREDVRPRMRGSAVRVEARRNGELGVRFEDQYVRIAECQPALKTAVPVAPKPNMSGINRVPVSSAAPGPGHAPAHAGRRGSRSAAKDFAARA